MSHESSGGSWSSIFSLVAAHVEHDKLQAELLVKCDQAQALRHGQFEEDIKNAERRANIDGAQEILWALQTQISDVTEKIGR